MAHRFVTVMVAFPQASNLTRRVLLQSVTTSACAGENVQEIMIWLVLGVWIEVFL